MAKYPESGYPLIDTLLEKIWPFLLKKDLVEVMSIKPGELILEFASGKFETVKVSELDISYWRSLGRNLSNSEGHDFDDDHPFVSAKLPSGHRFEMLIGRWVESGLSVTIRIFRRLSLPLSAYGLTREWAERIEQAVRGRLNILISGGTQSGKTTFTNSILRYIPKTERVLTLEDVRELDCPHIENLVHYKIDRHGRGVSYDQMFDHFMRSRPDRIIMGELSVRNAKSATMLLSTGHKGFLSTLHANSCLEAMETAFHDRLELSGHHVDRDHLSSYLRRNVDAVFQVAKTPEGRRITEVWFPAEEAEPVMLHPH